MRAHVVEKSSEQPCEGEGHDYADQNSARGQAQSARKDEAEEVVGAGA